MALLADIVSGDDLYVVVVRLGFFLAGPLLLTFIAQRLYFHPLSKYPGPWLNALSPIPEVLAIVAGRQHAYHRKLHERYGPVVRASPNELIFCGADAWDDIYGNKPGKPDMEKAPIQAGGLPQGIPARALTLAPWEDHVRQRKAFAYPFSNTALLQQEPLVQKHVAKLIAELQKLAEGDRPVNIAAWLTYTTFDMIGELCFAEPFGCLDQGQSTEWAQCVVNIANAGMYEQATRRIAGVGTRLQKFLAKWCIPKEFARWRQDHFAKSKEKTMRRIADTDRDHKDFLYFVLKNNEAKSLLSELEIVMNTALFIGAGSDTTALMLTSWANMMLRNPSSYQKLVAEVRGSLRSVQDITWQNVKDLEYLGAVSNEVFRICAPVPTNLCRVVPPEGAAIDGKFVPGGTTVSVSPWAATHLDINWVDPLSFRPERWLGEGGGKYGRDKKHASQPFSYGPRGCIGKNLSQIEQRLIICHLLYHFDMSNPTVGGGKEKDWEMEIAADKNKLWDLEDDMRHMKAWLVWQKPDLWVKLKEVER
ncbi:cytochrome P450 [Diplogelasinospora grovesii]|uniref:Cytochrome P450 n=1 Tax=Diplogelasinospora grovesii TaxID=303347 RepID=A0AAN6N3H4_9PEZI|nr:cytochrome P450 [Diplogelasinospora grovesii]